MNDRQKLTWEEIRQRYENEWVELIDYDWAEEEPHPQAGVVRVHAKARREFDRLATIDAPTDSAYVYVGRRESPSGTTLSTFRILETH